VSLPFAPRFRVANDHRLLSAVLTVCLRAILGFQRDRARRILGLSGRCGAVTAVQRFGGALNLNVHFHVPVLDGVHGVHGETAPGRVAFRALARPTAAELQALAETIARRVRALLRRLGLLEEAEEPLPDGEDAALASCRVASARGLSALSGRAGRPVRPVRPVRMPDPDGSAGTTAPRPPASGGERPARAPAPASAGVDRPAGAAGDVREWADPSPHDGERYARAERGGPSYDVSAASGGVSLHRARARVPALLVPLRLPKDLAGVLRAGRRSWLPEPPARTGNPRLR
jgi:hypothetical protein